MSDPSVRAVGRNETRIDRDEDGAIDDLFMDHVRDVHAEMMSEETMLILAGRCDGRTSRLSVWAKRGRWPWSPPVLCSLYEDDY